jgi:predicted MFS family arabinose efflux permease
MLAMVLFGVGEISGSFFIGFFIDRIGSKFSTLINIMILTIMGGITVAYLAGGSFNATAWLMCFFWGF